MIKLGGSFPKYPKTFSGWAQPDTAIPETNGVPVFPPGFFSKLPADGKPHHVAAVVRREGSAPRYYVDGVEVAP